MNLPVSHIPPELFARSRATTEFYSKIPPLCMLPAVDNPPQPPVALFKLLARQWRARKLVRSLPRQLLTFLLQRHPDHRKEQSKRRISNTRKSLKGGLRVTSDIWASGRYDKRVMVSVGGLSKSTRHPYMLTAKAPWMMTAPFMLPVVPFRLEQMN